MGEVSQASLSLTVARIFISYRADDATVWAISLRDEICRDYGEGEVAFNHNTVVAGKWHARIEEALASSRVLVVEIGPRWLSSLDANGRKRLLRDDDCLRYELASAPRNRTPRRWRCWSMEPRYRPLQIFPMTSTVLRQSRYGRCGLPRTSDGSIT